MNIVFFLTAMALTHCGLCVPRKQDQRAPVARPGASFALCSAAAPHIFAMQCVCTLRMHCYPLPFVRACIRAQGHVMCLLMIANASQIFFKSWSSAAIGTACA